MAEEDRNKNFDFSSFYAALDATRDRKDMTWKEVGEATNVSPATLTRMRQGKRPDADSLAELAAWAGLNPADFVRNTMRAPAEALALISSHLRSDPNLTKESATAIDEMVRAAYRQLAKKPKA
jgi:transcriptional regulator with XRE-family HTH domain